MTIEVTTEQTNALIAKLKAWRKANSLSQRQATIVMHEHGLPITITGLQKWEGGFRSPGRFAAKAIEEFLDEHPTISKPPIVGRWKIRLPDAKVKKIRQLRENGATLLSIAEKFRISESSVSRICAGNRRAPLPSEPAPAPAPPKQAEPEVELRRDERGKLIRKGQAVYLESIQTAPLSRK
jgi:transcriptional regulator with XRE-family HTH domain